MELIPNALKSDSVSVIKDSVIADIVSTMTKAEENEKIQTELDCKIEVNQNENSKEKSLEIKTNDDNKTSILSFKITKSLVESSIVIGIKSLVEAQEELLNELVLCDNPYNCPHGRPTIIKFSIYDLERMFKRVMN